MPPQPANFPLLPCIPLPHQPTPLPAPCVVHIPRVETGGRDMLGLAYLLQFFFIFFIEPLPVSSPQASQSVCGQLKIGCQSLPHLPIGVHA